MKRKGVVICVLVLGLLRNAEGQTGITVDYNELKIIPPSPSVAELGRYGLASARLGDGAFSTQIPLYEYKTKNLTLPISLQYSTNGLLVNKVAGRVGMDWSLVAGGSISRMVLNYPDESKPFVTYPLGFPNSSGDSLEALVSNLVAGAIETVPDIYNFSFNGYSGRFLYVNGTITKLEQNSLIIQKITNGFQVTDNSGIVYTFTKVESSLSFSNCAGNPYSQGGYISNAWMLTQISHPLGDIIYLTYETCQFTYGSGVSQTMISEVKETDNASCPSTVCTAMQQFRQCVSSITNNGLILTKISSNYRGMVNFLYESRSDQIGDSALKSITVVDTGTIHNFGFDYLFPTSLSNYNGASATNTQRMFLSDLYADDKHYSFQYNYIDSLPPQLSFSQDQFGYFNGKINPSLVPAPTDPTDYTYLKSYGYGNRLPDYTYALRGALSKIIYPTGGTDSVEYESHSIYQSGSFNCNNLNVSNNPLATGSSTLKVTTSYYSNVFTVNCGQIVNFEVANLPSDTDLTPSEYNTFAGLVQATQGSPIVPNAPFVVSEDMYGKPIVAGKGQDLFYRVNIPPGTYRLEIGVLGPAKGTGDFSYMDDTSASGNISIAGVRVSQIITSTLTAPPLSRKYYYTSANTNASSGVTVDEFPNYLVPLEQFLSCPGGGNGGANCGYATCKYNEYTSNDFYSLYSYQGNHIYYRTVTEDLGNNFADGYIEHDFFVSTDQNALIVTGTLVPGTPLSNFGIYNGFEDTTKYYKNTGDGFTLVKKVFKIQYSDPRLSSDPIFYAFKTDAGFYYSCLNIQAISLSQYEGLHTADYDMLSRWLYADSLTTIDYDNNGNALTSRVTNSYGNPVHQELTQTQSLNSKGQNITTDLYYPSDSTSVTDPTALAAISSLTSSHMLNSLLRRKTYNGTTLIKDEQNYYSGSLLGSVPVLNKQYEADRGDTLELKIQVTKYGPGGTILEAKINGIEPVSYLWDYEQQYPIAMISNSLSSDAAYTSFEADGSGNWTIPDTTRIRTTAITGSRSYNLKGTNSITRTGLTSTTTYIVGYWGYSGNSATVNGSAGTSKITIGNWTYYEAQVSGITTVTIGGTGTLDELRLFPKGSLMTTYTYAPLIGMTTQGDASGKLTYYTYDKYGRLHLIMDQYENILKRYDYEYQSTNN